MLIPEIDSDLVNKIFVDAYKRVSGVFLIDKPVGVTSHDVVDDVRKVLRTRKVGHAGALDPFASGVLIILVGKYTKYTEALINLDKTYVADVVLGVSTTTQDPEGEVINSKDVNAKDEEKLLDQEMMDSLLKEKFQPRYEQLVPIYSSVKLDGQKLRKLARAAEKVEKLERGKVKLHYKSGDEQIIDLPTREVKIAELELHSTELLDRVQLDKSSLSGKFINYKIEVTCSKGTYIRQLAEDIGYQFDYPSFLSDLSRTAISKFSLQNAILVDDLYVQAKSLGILRVDKSELNLNTEEQ
jgi:tRNA pseudouridine55 synthase